MPDQHWEKLKEIFQAASVLEPGKRSAYLDKVCGEDSDLRRSIESLLSAFEETGNFMDVRLDELATNILADSDLKPGQVISHYRIVRQLGEGGMGKVYLAEDTALRRKVSLKFLGRSALEQELSRRFQQEAHAISALNHPNTVTIHEIGESDGLHFIVTEFIDGRTLREHIQSGLQVNHALDIAIQVATALLAAHRVNIIHRDIKPENIMIREDDGLVKVLDFGLAKLAKEQPSHPEDATLELVRTKTGVVMGTVAYMSPEQARGLPVDGRTDIWSLGVVLYEMLAGRNPYAGPTSGDVIVSILDRKPPPLATVASHTPPQLQKIVERTLAKDLDQRYESMANLLTDLRAIRRESEFQNGQRPATQESGDSKRSSTNRAEATSASQSDPSPASSKNLFAGITRHKLLVGGLITGVLLVALASWLFINRGSGFAEKDTILLADFINNTGDSSFDGSTLKQALAVQLRQTPFLSLLPEESVQETLRYMGLPEHERITLEIGREICRRRGLKAVLVGTISGLGHNYVITLQALNGFTSETIASQQVEAQSKEQVLKSLGQAALELRKQLGESLSTLKQYNAPIEQATTSSLDALNVYSKGLEQMYAGDYQQALPLFNRAVELDPSFAEAYVWLSWTYSNFSDLGRAAEYAAKAYGLRDRVTELEKLHIDEIYHLYATGNFEKQKEADQVIMRLYPNDWLAPASLGFGYLRIGQLELALTEFQVALKANPNQCHLYMNTSTILMRLKRLDEAREAINEARTRKLEHFAYRRLLFVIALAQHDTTDMQRQLESIRKADGDSEALAREARVAVLSGRWHSSQEFDQRSQALSNSGAHATERSHSYQNIIDGALLGFCQPASNDISQLLSLSRISSPVQILFVPILPNGALCGNTSAAQILAEEQEKRYPDSTLTHVYSLPIIRAAIALQQERAEQAVDFLNAALPYDGGFAGYWPNYLRGQAYLRMHRGADAAMEFQKIIDHPGWDAESAMYPLAHLGLARAAILTGDDAKARSSFQEFLTLWKDADPDIPILLEARNEYGKLK